MNNVTEIKEHKQYLVAVDGVTRSEGVGMGDNGGYPTVYFHVRDKTRALEEKIEGGDRVRVFALREVKFDNIQEYKKYLELKEKYSKLKWVGDEIQFD